MADPHLTDAAVKSIHGRVTAAELSLEQMAARLGKIETDMRTNATATAKNTDSIEQIRQNTQDIIDTFQALAGGFKVLQGLGRLAKPLAYIVGLVTAVITAYSAWRGIK
ncbi:hypothetical protein F1536_12410 [Achromobacter xylosoxidans]|uniref:hypothetical protein n=1 Tax=Alcaligenes xylosoxydans xylosoxydans TaxID=85698 RepID=UPI001231A18B|nr:hypothetical protein [Achromobacter xylosoxidans]KAA5926349.1 hypothetical protein F1536_12410 [Achromobacter xylosoxidans]